MSALLRRSCCCKRRGDGGGGGPPCDPSKFPSAVIISGSFSIACRNNRRESPCNEFRILTTFSLTALGGAGRYSGRTGSGSHIAHTDFLSECYGSAGTYSVSGHIEAGVTLTGCGEGFFEWVPDPGEVNPYFEPINASFKNINAQCGSCGIQNARGMMWLGGPGNWGPAIACGNPNGCWIGSTCCGITAGDGFSGQCLCAFGNCDPTTCDECLGLSRLSDATMSVS